MAEDLVGKVINFFTGDSGELSDKEMILKQRHKELSENKYAKFYRTKTDEADQSLGAFFYSLYKMIMPVRAFMKDTAKTTRLRQITLEAFLDPAITETVKRLSPAHIDERAKTTAAEELTGQIRQDIEKMQTGFNRHRIDGVNRCYNLVMIFSQLVNFDYPSLLKKFDANFTEGPFGGEPKFSAVKGSLLAKDLGQFLTVSQGVNPDYDWKTLLKLIRICAGEELIQEGQFGQMLIGLRDIVNSKILELMVQYGSNNPVWTCRPQIPDEHIAEAWLELRIGKAQEYIDKINNFEKNQQIGALVKEVFDNEDLSRLENYTVRNSENYRKRDLSDFAYAEGLNYLSAFLDDYLQKDIRELCDILLIRGQWTNNAHTKEMSEALYQLLNFSVSVSDLDEALADEGPDGSRLKAALLRIDRDKTQARYINSIVDNINEKALELINEATGQFIILDKYLKNLTDDIHKKHPELIINWRELNSVSKEPLPQLMEEVVKKLNSCIQLMRLCAQ